MTYPDNVINQFLVEIQIKYYLYFCLSGDRSITCLLNMLVLKYELNLICFLENKKIDKKTEKEIKMSDFIQTAGAVLFLEMRLG